MKIAVSVPQPALIAADTHKAAEELANIKVEGALLAVTYPDGVTLEQLSDFHRELDIFLAGKIADSDDGVEITALSALKKTLLDIGADTARTVRYKTRVRESAEAIEIDAGSQLHANSHTDISISPSSNGATLETNEEVSEDYGTQEQSAAEQPARSGAGRRRKR